MFIGNRIKVLFKEHNLPQGMAHYFDRHQEITEVMIAAAPRRPRHAGKQAVPISSKRFIMQSIRGIAMWSVP